MFQFIGKFIERAFWFFPAFLIGAILFLTFQVIDQFSWERFGLLVFTLYLFPPLLYRLISIFIPIKIGRMELGPLHEPCGWMIAHRIQMIYFIFPFLERILISLPGLYSNWLRLWGSKIGSFVYWAPNVDIQDRTHLTIDEKTFVGGAVISCHLVIPKGPERFVLNFQPIHIGSHCFISAQCNIGPGSKIQKETHLKIMTQTLGTKKRELV
jgi:hypothetical protein